MISPDIKINFKNEILPSNSRRGNIALVFLASSTLLAAACLSPLQTNTTKDTFDRLCTDPDPRFPNRKTDVVTKEFTAGTGYEFKIEGINAVISGPGEIKFPGTNKDRIGVISTSRQVVIAVHDEKVGVPTPTPNPDSRSTRTIRAYGVESRISDEDKNKTKVIISHDCENSLRQDNLFSYLQPEG